METFKPIPNAEGYEVSDTGTVRRLVGSRNGKPLASPVVVRQSMHRKGYPVVSIRIDGRPRTVFVQRIMLEAFVGPPPSPDHTAMNRNGNRKDITPANIFWGTGVDRTELRHIHGTQRERPSRYENGKLYYECIYCDRWLPSDQFYKLAKTKSRHGRPLSSCGLASDCRECSNQKRAERRRGGGMA